MRMPLLALAAVLAVRQGTAEAQSVTVIDTALLAAPRLIESSGVTASARAGVFWSHNDSGDGPFLYAADSVGHDLGRVRVRGASAVDWEDIEAGPCFVVPGRCLYIGDIGDNRARRTHVTLYRIPEPAVPAGASDTLGTVDVLDSLIIRYPGGPRDAEAVIVTPDGWLLLVSKPRDGRPRQFWARVDVSGPLTLSDGGPLPITVNLARGRLVTGGAATPDGRWVVLRTYVSLHFFEREGTLLRPATRPDGIPIPVVEAQGEGITFEGPDRLVLTSEQGQAGHGMILRLRVRLPER
jgi:hypothetical protein